MSGIYINAIFSKFLEEHGFRTFDNAKPGEEDRKFAKKYAPKEQEALNSFENDLADLEYYYQEAAFKAGFFTAVDLLQNRP